MGQERQECWHYERGVHPPKHTGVEPPDEDIDCGTRGSMPYDPDPLAVLKPNTYGVDSLSVETDFTFAATVTV